MEPTSVLVPRESPGRPLPLWEVLKDWQMSFLIWSRLFLNFWFCAGSQDASVCIPVPYEWNLNILQPFGVQAGSLVQVLSINT